MCARSWPPHSAADQQILVLLLSVKLLNSHIELYKMHSTSLSRICHESEMRTKTRPRLT